MKIDPRVTDLYNECEHTSLPRRESNDRATTRTRHASRGAGRSRSSMST
jgi:hypothetical protein